MNRKDNKHICNTCNKAHSHYHIDFVSGGEYFDECKNCCKICKTYSGEK